MALCCGCPPRFGVALIWHASRWSPWRGVAQEGSAQLEVALPSSLASAGLIEEARVGQVIIGVDPHKRSATIEVVDEHGQIMAQGRYGTDNAGYAEMLQAVRRFPDRVWAVEGCNGIGKHLAHRVDPRW